MRVAEICVAPFHLGKHYLPALNSSTKDFFQGEKTKKKSLISVIIAFSVLCLSEKSLQVDLFFLFSDQQGQQVVGKSPKQQAIHSYPP